MVACARGPSDRFLEDLDVGRRGDPVEGGHEVIGVEGWTAQLTVGEERDEGVSAAPRMRLRQHDLNCGWAFGNNLIQRQPSMTVSLRSLMPSVLR